MNEPSGPRFGTGRIQDIVQGIETSFGAQINEVPWKYKLDALCTAMQISHDTLDLTIAQNSPVLRTVKGHAFEIYFDHLMAINNSSSEEIGGDGSVDRIVNNHTLQLKTPTQSGTTVDTVQFKTHKTHGAKSERESIDYYHLVEEFPDFLVGLISYDPLRILILARDELPRHRDSPNHIQSPFSVKWTDHPAVNAFDRLGVTVSTFDPFDSHEKSQALIHTSTATGVPSEIVVDTITSRANFRIWDMSIRGFLRENVFKSFAMSLQIDLDNPLSTGRMRADKADFVMSVGGELLFLQMKGISTNNCDFNVDDPVIATETQLTRGRVNDHPTQSRLYLETDFDYLILGLDPPISLLCNPDGGLKWEFFAIPTSHLERHPSFQHRLKSLQKFRYSEILEFKLTEAGQFS